MHNENNFYYGDNSNVFSNGGWNYSEMIRYTRNYAGEDDGTAANEIQTPLKLNAQWMHDRYTYGP